MSGCGRQSDQDRLKSIVPNAVKTTPVKGKVLVDGKPVTNIWVTLHPENETKESLLPKAQSDASGNFAVGTYIGADGAPPGNYKITVEWLTYNQFGGRWSGPSKIDDKFASASTTPFEVTVADKSVDVPVLEVQAKKDADQIKSKSNPRAERQR